MSKHSNRNQNHEQQVERDESLVGGDAGEQQQPETEVHSTEQEAQDATVIEVPKVQVSMGIGQFVRHMLLKSTKTNAEILELVAKHFPESKTTPACIAWYKSDLRKKGLLAGGATRGATKIVALSEEQLAELVK